MGTQHQVTKKQKLLDENGNIKEPGFAYNQVWEYSRDQIKAPKWRIKEWDYYYIGTNDYGLCLTVSDCGYVGTVSASLLDFKNKTQINKTAMQFFTMGKLNMPPTPDIGDIYGKCGLADFAFENDGKEKHLSGVFNKFYDNLDPLVFDITLYDIPKDHMVIATPFKKDKHFYYNQKTNCLKAKGYFTIKGEEYNFEDNKGLATLDWGRGVWTYDNTWYWGSLNGYLEDGRRIGWNIGYGFGDTSQASENMVFIDGIANKLDEITFNIPQKDGKDDYLSPWTFTSNDKRFEMEFTPLIDRQDPLDLKFLAMIPHQVFGIFNGKIILDNKEEVKITNLIGFAEKVHNKW